MGKLNKYASGSRIMEVSFKIGRERFKFNLSEELKVDEDTVSRELMSQPNSYAFLLMIRAKLNKYVKNLDKEKKALRATKWEDLIQTKNPYTTRPWTKDEIQFKLDNDEEVDELDDKLMKRQYELELIDNCIRSFEQRSDLIRTLSANLRSQKL